VSDEPSVSIDFGLTPQQPSTERGVEIVVVGRDALGIDVCRRLVTAGRRVAAVWPQGAGNMDEIEQLKLAHVIGDARRAPVLSRAGIRVAHTLVAVSNDDQFNLRVALAARDVNPAIRVVLRQFNRRLGQKITRQFTNSEAVSPETHSAATYAASCLNHWVYQALEFPRYSEDLVVFCRGSGADFGAAGSTVADLGQRRGWQVLALDGRRFPDGTAQVAASADVTIASRLEAAPAFSGSKAAVEGSNRPILIERGRRGIAQALRGLRVDPIFLSLAAAFLTLVIGATSFFHFALGMRWIDAFYHVANTVTTTGADARSGPAPDSARLVEIVLMFGSVSIVGVLLAYITAAITRRSIELAQGRHRVSTSGHVVVCGFGNVGSRVVQYLLHQGVRVAVIDRNPDTALADEARARGAHIMIADATSESALKMARVTNAVALLALTDSDSANLEIALTADSYAPGIPVIMRIAEPATARAVERHFKIRASYSAAALAAPLVAGLALERGSRGTIDIAGVAYPLVQRKRSDGLATTGEVILASDDDNILVLRSQS
jgi:Trk K+ transport system NAD-binding subunit